MKRYNVGIIGCTGMVGQRFITILDNHPWFTIKVIAASSRSSGKFYEEAVGNRWVMKDAIPEKIKSMTVLDAVRDRCEIAAKVDFIFCAVDMKKSEIRELEEQYAKLECPVISNNSAHRSTPDVPMIIPEVNPEHAQIIADQRERLGTKRGFIAVKSNCSIQSYVPALHPLLDLKIKDVAVCTYQAISGAGKTFDTWPEMIDNLIPYIGGEEEKSEKEPMKIWGHIENGEIVNAVSPKITAQCIRVPVSDGHMAAVFVSFENKASNEEIIRRWNEYENPIQKLNLPSAPKQFLTYFHDDNRPQIHIDRELEHGMGVSVGRLRDDSVFDIKFVSLSHNTLRGAAGGAVLMAELLCAQNYI